MTLHALPTLILIAGVLHLCITSAGLVMTIVLDWRKNLAVLSPLTRHIIWTHGAFVLITIVAFGAVSLLCPTSLASGHPIARAVCAFIAIFWSLRLLIGFAAFDARPYLSNTALKLGYHGLTVVFAYFSIVYALAAAFPRP